MSEQQKPDFTTRMDRAGKKMQRMGCALTLLLTLPIVAFVFFGIIGLIVGGIIGLLFGVGMLFGDEKTD